jgi:gluconolactonase
MTEGFQVYYILPDHRKLTRATNDLVKPNGLIGTPDGKIIYIADAGDNKTWAYNIKPDGRLSDKRLFCKQGSDGMAIDERNNVYVTGKSSISVYNSEGEKIEEIVFPERPANMTFAGKERKTLFVTARTSVYTLEMVVRGMPTPLEKEK